MNGKEFIELAGRLAASKSDAASCRTAISRAYYGAFHVSRDLLRSLGYSAPRSDSVHVFIQHRLYNCGIEELRKAAAYLSDLHSDRLKADYQLTDTSVEHLEIARDNVENAMRVLAAIDACQSPEVLQQIKDGIAAYEDRVSN